MTKQLFKTKAASAARLEIASHLANAFSACGMHFEHADILASLDESSKPSSGELARKTFIFSKKYKVEPVRLVDCLHRRWTTLLQYIEKMDVALPYINFTLRYDWLSANYASLESAIKQLESVDLGRVVVEHTQPNTHKFLHVGHLRNTILGDTIFRLFRFFADDVYAVDYHGDEGAHVTKVVWYIKTKKIDLDKTAQDIPEATERSEWLGKIYAIANAEIDTLKSEGTEIGKELAQILRNIEDRAGEDYKIWKTTRDWSMEGFTQVYDWLGVHFDKYYSESLVSESSQKRVDEYLQKGVFHISDGAVGIDLSDEDLGFCMVRKSDGTGLYATKDIELAIRRSEDYDPDVCIYVVDQRQSLHFRQVFATLRRMGFEIGHRCYHLGYDVVQSKEGAFSSRLGNAISANQLIDRMILEATKVAQSKPEISEESVTQVALAAVRNGMLRVDPLKKVTFDAEEWTKFEGDTGPYLLYSYARAKSVLRKARSEGFAPSVSFDGRFFFDGMSSEQRHLMFLILSTKENLAKAAQSLKPSLVCTHAFRTSQVFNAQYTKEKVLGSGRNEQEVCELLLLYSVFCQFLEIMFSILGWSIVEEL